MTPEDRIKLTAMFMAMSTEDLRDINNTLVAITKNRRVQVAHSFQPGDRVSFVSKQGRVTVGTVLYVMQKNVKVKTDGGIIWRISGTLLTKVK